MPIAFHLHGAGHQLPQRALLVGHRRGIPLHKGEELTLFSKWLRNTHKQCRKLILRGVGFGDGFRRWGLLAILHFGVRHAQSKVQEFATPATCNGMALREMVRRRRRHRWATRRAAPARSPRATATWQPVPKQWIR
eukprot:7440283-Prorocentrum_lima.AAC.1